MGGLDRGIYTLPEMVARSAQDFGSRPALIKRTKKGDVATTYSQLWDDVQLLARGLLRLGLQPGEKVAILGPNSPEWGKAYLAVSTAQGICVPLDSFLTKNELNYLLVDSSTQYAFVASRFLDQVIDTGNRFPGLRKVVILDHESGPLPSGTISFQELIAIGEKGPGITNMPALDEIAVIIYTSGTTGRPKGVMLTHRNLVSDCAACYQAIEVKDEHFLSVLPMHHTFECTGGFLFPIYSGCVVTYARSLKSRYILEDLKASGATVILGVPLLFPKILEGIKRGVSRQPALKRRLFHYLMNTVRAGEYLGMKDLGRIFFKGLRQKAGLGSLRFLIVGGAPLLPKIPREFRRLGLKMIQGYGLTEASPILTLNPKHAPRDDSIGRPLPGVEVKVVDPDEDGIGELAFKGPMVMKGYYKNQKATREVLTKDGWLLTGDLGRIDKEGYCYITGRGKNLIVTPAGRNVSPEEIEEKLVESPYILEAMVFGRPLPIGGEEVRAIVVPDYKVISETHKKRPTDKVVRRLISKEIHRVNQEVSGYKRIKGFTLRDEELPKTSTRKIKRHLVTV